MADVPQDPEEVDEESPSPRFLLPAIIGASVVAIIGVFSLGFITLTTPTPLPDDLLNDVTKKEFENDQDATIGEDEAGAMASDDEGAFNFKDHSYFSFPLPFVLNFPDGKGMLTLELAVAIYATPLRSESLLEKLSTFMPKMRSAINLALAEITYENVDTVSERTTLEKQLLEAIRKIVEGEGNLEPSGISNLHFIKFVAS
jgi:flagellar basal body-associated protein FliL